MKSIQELREQRNRLALEVKNLVEADGDWSPENDAKFEDLSTQISKLDGEITRNQKAIDIAATAADNISARSTAAGISEDEAENQIAQLSELTNQFLRGGMSALNSDQQETVRANMRAVRNDMGTQVGAEGGFLVPSPMSQTILTAMSAHGGMREAATVIKTGNGAAMDFPTSDARSEEGEIVGENAPATKQDISFGSKPFPVQKFSSKVVTVPFELLEDSEFNLEAYVIERLGQRLARATNRYYTVGTGLSQPEGVNPAAELGRIGEAGETDSITFDSLTELEHAVDPAYRANARFMFHDQTLKSLKKLKDANNRPLWMPGHDVKEPDTINGRPFTINQHIPVMAASARSALFGDFSKYVIRDVMSILLFRLTDSKYTENGQVGFLAWMRTGGALMDVGGAVQAYQNAS